MSPGSIAASLLFGAIGFALFVFGKKQARFLPLVTGMALMGYPYFVSGAVANWAIGTAILGAFLVALRYEP